MVGDFVSSGTAIAPPLVVLILFAVATALVRRTDRWGAAASIVLVLLSVLMIVGSLGEATAPPTPDVPRAVQLFSGASGTAFGVLIAGLAIGALFERRTGSERADSA
jgi:hypothetical protein